MINVHQPNAVPIVLPACLSLLFGLIAFLPASPVEAAVQVASAARPPSAVERVPDGLSAADWSAIRAAYEAGRRDTRDHGNGAHDGSGAHAAMGDDPLAQQAYLKASNTGESDIFGTSVAVSGDTVVVGANFEDSNATGVNGDQADNSTSASGAAYVFVRDEFGNWSQQAYLKASNTGAFDRFGESVAVSGDTVVVGAYLEDSNTTGVNAARIRRRAADSDPYGSELYVGGFSTGEMSAPILVGTVAIDTKALSPGVYDVLVDSSSDDSISQIGDGFKQEPLFGSVGIHIRGDCDSGSQPWNDPGFALKYSDLGVGSGLVQADDFVAEADLSTITQIITWGYYLTQELGGLPLDCGGTLSDGDHFRVRVLPNGLDDLPDAANPIGTSTATSLRTLIPSNLENFLGLKTYEYELTLDDPIGGLQEGVSYWLEIANNLPAIDECGWMWSVVETPAPNGNRYSASGWNNLGYASGSQQPIDLAWCLDGPVSTPSAPTRACCPCAGGCSTSELSTCSTGAAAFQPDEETCPPTCDASPANDNCASALPAYVGATAFATNCATTDGYNGASFCFDDTGQCGGGGIGRDLWYQFIAPQDCTLRVDMCQTATFDSAVAIYSDLTSTCPCPTDQSSHDAVAFFEAHDESCAAAQPVGGAGRIEVSGVQAGDCYTIRVGNYNGQGTRGPGLLQITCGPPICGNNLAEASNGEECDGSDDADCESIAGAGAVCVAAGFADECTCRRCGDNLREGEEQCDGTDDGACPGLCTAECTCSNAAIRYVNAARPNDSGDGLSWAEAKQTLQAALADAQSEDEIWVAAGTYTPDQGVGITPGDRTATFQLLDGVALYGGFAGGETELSQRNIAANPTILNGDLDGNDAPVACVDDSPDCDSNGGLCGDDGFCIIADNNDENSYHVVTGSGTDATAVLDGFTITAGNADGTDPNEQGAGMYNNAGSPTVTYCTFRNNSAVAGGSGMANYGGSSPTVVGCTFIWNWAGFNGGGMYSDGGSPSINGCVFRQNSAANNGGGMFNYNTSPTVTNCVFSGNSSPGGGGMFNDVSSPTVTNCAFYGNTASQNGGGVFNFTDSNPTVVNCTFSSNSADLGGAVYNTGANTITLTNCTFSQNGANSGGGIYNFDSFFVDVANCILWGNYDAGGTGESGQVVDMAGTVNVNYSIIQGLTPGIGGIGNLDVDPLFVDGEGPNPGAFDNILDLRLQPGSPAIDAGDTTALPADTADLNNNGNTAERIPWDLDGKPRVVDDPDTVDTGVPGSAVVDMGAYEYFPDCNGTGLPHECDLDCNALDGTCDLPGCGQSQDCVGNGIPNECVIAECDDMHPDYPGCDDCNLNGIPDVCDIADMTSEDADLDGVPDECAFFLQNCTDVGVEDHWTCPDNWDLDGLYPDDESSAAGVFTTLAAGADVFLDDMVTIPALRLATGSQLRVTQVGADGDLRLSEPTAGRLSEPSVGQPGRLSIQGTMLIGDGRSVGPASGAPDPRLTVRADGTVTGAGCSGGTAAGSGDGTLIAGDVLLTGVNCSAEPCPHGGAVECCGNMTFTASGDVVIDGNRNYGPCDGHHHRDNAPRRFAHTPPILSIRGNAVADFGGTLAVAGAARLVVDSTVSVTVGRDFDNHSISPDCFDWAQGSLVLNGAEPQMFEVAATDVGTVKDPQLAEYAIGALTVAVGAEVTFRDVFDNDQSGQGPCTEALYVGALTLEADSVVVLNNVRVYYESIKQHPTATVTQLGCGELLSVSACPSVDAALAESDVQPKNRYLSFQPQNAGVETALRVRLESLSGFGSFNGQVRWVGPPVLHPEGDGNQFWAAALQCTPHFRDWSTVTEVHVYGAEVVPSSTYHVQVVHQNCESVLGDEFSYSAPLAVSTGKWGDVRAPYGIGQPDIIDIVALVDKFGNNPGAVIKARAQLQPNIPNPANAINVLDISACVSAFGGGPYSFAGPTSCP